MSERLRLAVDMDEVLADAHAAQEDWLGETIPGYHPLPAGTKYRDHLTAEQNAAREAMLHEGSIFGRLAPMPGSATVLERLCDRHEVFIATAAMEYPRSCQFKYDWIREHLPFVNPMNIVFCGDKSVVRADVLIDDNARHFPCFSGQGVLFAASHNENDPWPDRVENWSEIRDRFLAA